MLLVKDTLYHLCAEDLQHRLEPARVTAEVTVHGESTVEEQHDVKGGALAVLRRNTEGRGGSRDEVAVLLLLALAAVTRVLVTVVLNALLLRVVVHTVNLTIALRLVRKLPARLFLAHARRLLHGPGAVRLTLAASRVAEELRVGGQTDFCRAVGVTIRSPAATTRSACAAGSSSPIAATARKRGRPSSGSPASTEGDSWQYPIAALLSSPARSSPSGCADPSPNTTVPPCSTARNTSLMLASNVKDANSSTRSPSLGAKRSASPHTKLHSPACSTSTPFGFPVDPDV